MEIKNTMTVTVYTFPHFNKFLQSAFSNFETLIEDYSLVAYSEDMELLFQSVEAYRYKKTDYIKDIMNCDSTEMTYIEYVQKYKDILNSKHADAPVLNDVHATQHTGRPEIPPELRPVSGFDKLAKLGINFKIG